VDVILFDRFDRHVTFADMARFIRVLRDRAPDAAFILPGGIEFALFYAWAGVGVRVGYDFDRRDFLLTHPVRVPRDFHQRYLSETYLDLGGLVGSVAVRRPHLSTTPPGARGNPGRGRHLRAASGRLRVVLHPWATFGPAKRWPAARFAELGARLAERFGAEIVLVGTEDARAAAAEINRLMHQGALDLTGQTSIADLCELLQQSALMISNDSGPAHLADALDVPLVVLFGSSSPTWTGPRGEFSEVIYRALECSPCFQRTCRLGTYACFGSITTDEVFERAERLLARGNPSAASAPAAHRGLP
jgi:heptosyltransferase-2